MANNVSVISATLPDATRTMLLRMFPPSFEHIYCRHLTYQYRAAADLIWPQGPHDCIITGRHIGDGHEALVCSFAGFHYRPDHSKRLHITVSVMPGVTPAQAGEIDEARIEPVNPVQFQLTLRRAPAKVVQFDQLSDLVLS